VDETDKASIRAGPSPESTTAQRLLLKPSVAYIFLGEELPTLAHAGSVNEKRRERQDGAAGVHLDR
jgi:hypothetical protein